MAALKGVEFMLEGDPTRARATLQEALEARKFRVTWTDDWTGVAERGSKVANVLLGALAQYFKVGVSIRSGDNGQSVGRLDRLSSGWMGGAIGAARTRKNLENLRNELQSTFQSAGVLVGVNSL
jgi:hypothetical protein